MDSVQSAKKLQAVQQKVQDAWNTECIPHARKGSQLTSPLKAFKWIGFAFLTNNVTLGLLWKYRNSLGASKTVVIATAYQPPSNRSYHR